MLFKAERAALLLDDRELSRDNGLILLTVQKNYCYWKVIKKKITIIAYSCKQKGMGFEHFKTFMPAMLSGFVNLKCRADAIEYS